MTMGSILTSLIMTAIIIAFVMFSAYFINKQTASVGFAYRFNQIIFRELQPLLVTIFVLIALIVIAIIGYAGITYMLKGSV